MGMNINLDNVRKTLAETVVTMLALQDDLRRRVADGTITTDEARTMPVVANNIRRLLESLKVTSEKDEEEDPL